MATSDTVSDAEAPPKRGKAHEALAVFLGDWKAEGQSFGGPNRMPPIPEPMRSNGRARIRAAGIPASFS